MLPLKYIPVFIVGAPRSGSTLLYQVMTEYYDFGYISNFHGTYTYGAPSFVEYLFHPLKWRKPSNFTSYHGRTEGLFSPSECGEYWYRFFRRYPQYVPLNEADPQKMKQMRASIRSLGNAFHKPLLFKNLMCTLRISPIASAIPEALFIVIRRDIVTNAHSLLKGRKDTYNDYSHWWSAEPPDIEQLRNLPPQQQVVEQIRSIYRVIDDDMDNIGKDRFHEIKYEELCEDPLGTLSGINHFFHINQVHVGKRSVTLPETFLTKFKIQIDPDLYQALTDYVNEQIL